MYSNPATVTALEAMTDFVAFEHMCCDLLASYGGYHGIVPQGIGRVDGGKDALLLRREPDNVSVVRQKIVFHFSLRKDYQKKLWADLHNARDRGIESDLTVFVTSRLVTPGVRETLERDAKSEFGTSVEIKDQHWLRVALDGDFQRIRKSYLGIDYDQHVFHDLESLLQLPDRHPNRDDFRLGAYYRNDLSHDHVHALLDARRLCLISGKPGHGKTALAKGIGYDLLSRDARHSVFYVSAGMGLGYDRWLQHMSALDHEGVTFILDDGHRAPEHIRALLEAWPIVRKARLLLVSRPLDANGLVAEEDNFEQMLQSESATVSVDPDEGTIGQVIDHIVRRDPARETGALDVVMRRCVGDLHILQFLAKAWQAQADNVALSDVPEEPILGAVYGRYLGGANRASYRQQIAAIAALSRFEIPVEASWVASEGETPPVHADSFVECFSESIDGIPVEFLRYFHSTPAHYVVQAAHWKGILGTPTPEAFVLERLTSYLLSVPANVFQVFTQLHRNGASDLTISLLNSSAVLIAVTRFIEADRRLISDDWMKGLVNLLCATRRTNPNEFVLGSLLEAFQGRHPSAIRNERLRGISAPAMMALSLQLYRADPHLATEVLDGFDYCELGRRASTVSLDYFLTYIGELPKAGAHEALVQAFCDGFDFKALGQRTPAPSLGRLLHLLYHMRKTTGVRPKHCDAFFEGLDFEALAERSSSVRLVSVESFLSRARRVGVSATSLGIFARALDWHRIGANTAPTVNRTSPLWGLHTLRMADSVTPAMARLFIEGMGWDTVRSIVSAPNAPDVLASLRALLTIKCGYTAKELRSRHVAFVFEDWFRSLTECAAAKVDSGGAGIQQNYVRYALKSVETLSNASLRTNLSGRQLTLRNWNVLIRNLKIVDVELVRREVEPILKAFSATDWTRLFKEADLKNLSVCSTHFAAGDGLFQWCPPTDATFDGPRFPALMQEAELIEIAHSLFAFRHVQRPEWCANLADAVDQDPSRVLQAIGESSLRTVEFFLWNLLTARNTLGPPALLRNPDIGRAIVDVAKRNVGNEQHLDLIALIGTLHLWGWPGVVDLLPLVDGNSIDTHVQAVGATNSHRLTRVLAGLAAVSSMALQGNRREVIRLHVDSFGSDLLVPSQELALARIRRWLDEGATR